MSPTTANPDELTTRILAARTRDRRCVVGIAGAPGSGKSTLAADLANRLIRAGTPTRVVPMDGFHLDNAILAERGLLSRKGAPETFDCAGFQRLVAALKTDSDVYYPMFDRDRDLAIAGAGHVGPDCALVLVEGNYLLLDEPGWRALAPLWDLSIRLDVPLDTLRARLVDRWLTHGLTRQKAGARADGNDLANAARIGAHTLPADILFTGNG